MRLNEQQQVNTIQIMHDICGFLPTVFENGTFEFISLNKSSKDTIINKLKKSSIIDEMYTIKNKNGNYKIVGMFDKLIEQLLEKADVEIHNELNPKIWNSKNELIPEVEKKIHEIVETFVNQLKEDDIDIIVDDIYIIGSNANFNYTDESDLDIHIIADESFDCSSEHLPIIYNSYKTIFNKNYDITINDVNVEIYVENKDKISNVSAGVYSLKNGWINKPAKYDIPKIDESKFEKELQKYEELYLDVIDSPTTESVENFIDKLYELRVNSIQKDGEFGLGNLIFKEFRHLGYLDELKELKNTLISKQLSL